MLRTEIKHSTIVFFFLSLANSVHNFHLHPIYWIHPTRKPTMLRRKPTAIAVTSEDLAAFENARLRKLAKENSNQANIENSPNTHFDPSDELKPLPGDKARIVRSREERIGIRRRN